MCILVSFMLCHIEVAILSHYIAHIRIPTYESPSCLSSSFYPASDSFLAWYPPLLISYVIDKRAHVPNLLILDKIYLLIHI